MGPRQIEVRRLPRPLGITIEPIRAPFWTSWEHQP